MGAAVTQALGPVDIRHQQRGHQHPQEARGFLAHRVSQRDRFDADQHVPGVTCIRARHARPRLRSHSQHVLDNGACVAAGSHGLFVGEVRDARVHARAGARARCRGHHRQQPESGALRDGDEQRRREQSRSSIVSFWRACRQGGGARWKRSGRSPVTCVRKRRASSPAPISSSMADGRRSKRHALNACSLSRC